MVSANVKRDHPNRDGQTERNQRVQALDRAMEVARMLLEIEAVSLRPDQPYTWSSGWKSPIYCDNRLTMSYPEVRSRIADFFVERIQADYPDAELIAGVATGGIPHAAWVAERLQLPMVYIRDKAKGHGKQNLIEGVLASGQKTVIIEDLFSTGGSSIRAAQAIRAGGGEIRAIGAIFSYEFAQAHLAFKEQSLSYWSLSRYSVLLEEALASGRIRKEDLERLRAWSDNPEAYGAEDE